MVFCHFFATMKIQNDLEIFEIATMKIQNFKQNSRTAVQVVMMQHAGVISVIRTLDDSLPRKFINHGASAP